MPGDCIFLQVVGVEGHNPSGHCLIASKLIDYVPMPVPVPSEEDLHPTKKQAIDREFQLTDPSMLGELSMVCKLGFHVISKMYNRILYVEFFWWLLFQ